MQSFEVAQEYVGTIPEVIQFLGVFIAAMIPFVEGYGAALVGTAVGVPVWLSLLSAILGNMVIVTALVFAADKTRSTIVARNAAKQEAQNAAWNATGLPADYDDSVESSEDEQELHDPEHVSHDESIRKQRIRKMFNRYGVPGVTILGMLFLPTHVVAPTLASFGLNKWNILLWNAIAITIYAVLSVLVVLGAFSLAGM